MDMGEGKREDATGGRRNEIQSLVLADGGECSISSGDTVLFASGFVVECGGGCRLPTSQEPRALEKCWTRQEPTAERGVGRDRNRTRCADSRNRIQLGIPLDWKV